MIGDALAGSMTFSDTIPGADEIPAEPIPGESGDKAARQPRTARKRTTRVRRPAPPAGGRRDASTAATVRQVRDELLAYVELLALGATVRCPQCAGVAHEQAEPIASALAALAARSPAVLRILRGGTLMAEGVQLMTALRPVYVQVRQHHFIPPPEFAQPAGGPNGAYPSQSTAGGHGRYSPYSGTGLMG